MSLSRKKLTNDLWLRLVELKCQSNFIQQIRSNQRNSLIALNEQQQRRVRLLVRTEIFVDKLFFFSRKI